MRLILFLVTAFLFSGCLKTEKNTTCGANPPQEVKFQNGFVVFANVFSPDGDSRDDAFGPVSYNLKSFHLTIKDGNDIVFETSDLNAWWDGTVGTEKKSGLYTYTFHGESNDGEMVEFEGQICSISNKEDVCFDRFSEFRFISLYKDGKFGDPEQYRGLYNRCD